jgi:hypothetical protein
MWTTLSRLRHGKHCPTSLRFLAPLLSEKSPSPQAVLMLQLPVDAAEILPSQLPVPTFARLPFGREPVPLSPCAAWMRKPLVMLANPAFNHCSAPISIGWVDDTDDTAHTDRLPQGPPLQLMNRNARRGKRANKGKRPCSRQRRRGKRRAFGNHRR